MDNNEANRVSFLIWSSLNCIENEKKSKSDHIILIKNQIIKIVDEQRGMEKRKTLNLLLDIILKEQEYEPK